MKKPALLLAVFTVLIWVTVTSCSRPDLKTLRGQENQIKTSKTIEKSNFEYIDSFNIYKAKNEQIIESNSQTIFELKERIKCKNLNTSSRYTISLLELKNSYMKNKLKEYEPDGEENWRIFKAEYDRDMTDLSREFKEMLIKTN